LKTSIYRLITISVLLFYEDINQDPETLRFCFFGLDAIIDHLSEYGCSYIVHALAVAYLGVVVRVGFEDSFETILVRFEGGARYILGNLEIRGRYTGG
jgi:hypothetical protein